MAVCPDFFQGLFFNYLKTYANICCQDEISVDTTFRFTLDFLWI